MQAKTNNFEFIENKQENKTMKKLFQYLLKQVTLSVLVSLKPLIITKQFLTPESSGCIIKL